MFAQFELRMLNVVAARQIMVLFTRLLTYQFPFQGNALGRCRLKKKLYNAYIDMEVKLREFDRCRTLYEKFLSHFETQSLVWRDFARLEYQLGEVERARAILQMGIEQENLDVPEVRASSTTSSSI